MTDIAREKRWVASLMVDLVGSTGITERLGAERSLALIEEVLHTAIRNVEAHGGHFIEYAGDSIFALFGAPVAVENATLSAGRAALDILDGVEARKADLEATYGPIPGVRIGLAAGEVLVSGLRFGGTERLNALGGPVNLAARLQAVATPNEVWCSEAVAEELRGLAGIEERGVHTLKGFEAPQRLYRIHWIEVSDDSLDIRLARTSGLFVGREQPLARLSQWMRGDAQAPGALWVSGPAGIGKSRLVRQARAHLPDGMAVHYGKCRAAEQTSPLRPLLGLLRDAAAHDGVADSAAFGPWLEALTGSEDAALAALLSREGRATAGADGTPAEDGAEGLRTRRQVARALHALACDPARRLVIEDMHWIDPVSHDVLQEVLDSPPSELRLLSTSRGTAPEETPWAAVPVDPLTERDVARLLEATHPDLAERDGLARALYRQSEGNPLFAEELMRHLDSGAEAMPDTLPEATGTGMIQNLVFSRFDTLPPADKAFLRQAAILGREVQPASLAEIGADGTSVHAILTRAADLYLVDPAAPGEPLRFAHVLYQNAIRDSITDAQATGLHRRAGEILLAAEETGSGDLAPDLAHHFDRAGDWPRAALYNVRAAQAAWRVYALDVAIDHLDRAAAALDAGGDAALTDAVFADFVTTFCRVLDVAGRWRRLSEVVARHLPRLEQQTQIQARLVVLMLNAKAFNQRGLLEQAEAAMEATIAEAARAGDAKAVAMANTVKMDILIDRKNGATVEEFLPLVETTRDYAHSGEDPHMMQMRLYEMSAFWRLQGDVPRARALAEEILDYGRRHDDLRARTFGGWIMASNTAMIEDYVSTRAYAAEAMCEALPGTMDYITAQAFHAGATLMLGAPAMTAEQLLWLSDARLEAGDTTMAIVAAFYAAGSLFLQGRIREGLGALDRTDSQVRAGCEWGLRQQYLIKRAESFLTVAGRLPSPLPQPRLALREIPAALGMRLRATSLARAAYDELDRDFGGGNGIHAARVDLGRGLLAGRKGRDRIRRARDVFAAQEAGELVDLAEKVL